MHRSNQRQQTQLPVDFFFFFLLYSTLEHERLLTHGERYYQLYFLLHQQVEAPQWALTKTFLANNIYLLSIHICAGTHGLWNSLYGDQASSYWCERIQCPIQLP